jgi:hypothetical protein
LPQLAGVSPGIIGAGITAVAQFLVRDRKKIETENAVGAKVVCHPSQSMT